MQLSYPTCGEFIHRMYKYARDTVPVELELFLRKVRYYRIWGLYRYNISSTKEKRMQSVYDYVNGDAATSDVLLPYSIWFAHPTVHSKNSFNIGFNEYGVQFVCKIRGENKDIITLMFPRGNVYTRIKSIYPILKPCFVPEAVGGLYYVPHPKFDTISPVVIRIG